MLNIKLINSIIIISLILLVVAFFVNPPFAQKSAIELNTPKFTQEPVITPFSISPTPAIKNLSRPIICNNPYFPLEKGASLDYRLEYKAGSKINKPLFFTNTIIEASGSSAIIETKIAKTKITSKHKISCRSDGIYGFPFINAIIQSDANTKEHLPFVQSLEKTLNNMFFIPDYDSLTKKKTWEVKNELSILPLPISLIFQGKSALNSNQTIAVRQYMRPSLNFMALPDLSTKVKIEAEMKENIGITNYTIKLVDEKDPLTIQISLSK